MKLPSFDSIFFKISNAVPFFGSRVSHIYATKRWFRTLAKTGITWFFIYYLARAPMMYVLTDVFGIWYIHSGFISGILFTFISWAISEWWIWKK